MSANRTNLNTSNLSMNNNFEVKPTPSGSRNLNTYNSKYNDGGYARNNYNNLNFFGKNFSNSRPSSAGHNRPVTSNNIIPVPQQNNFNVPSVLPVQLPFPSRPKSANPSRRNESTDLKYNSHSQSKNIYQQPLTINQPSTNSGVNAMFINPIQNNSTNYYTQIKKNNNQFNGTSDQNKTDLNYTNNIQQEIPPQPSRPSSASNRIRIAITQGNVINKEQLKIHSTGNDLIDSENQNDFYEDTDEMDGKKINSSRISYPEVSITTPSQSIELNDTNSIDARNSSVIVENLEEKNIGRSTIPNRFCNVSEAIDLKKLLMLSKGSRGGIVPSSTAVMDMYMVGKVIGVGSYGKVRVAWHRLTAGKVAIKTYDKSKLTDPAHWKRVHSEIKIMEQISHPRIARMYEAIETPKRMHLIIECIDGGNLCSYVKAKKRLSEEESKRIFFQILQAIEHLHALGVSHRY